MAWSFFRRAATTTDGRQADWWRAAHAALVDPANASLDHLTATLIDPSQLDERERQEEMLEAVSRVIALDAAALPELETQHRVIGTDRCHFMAPVSAPDHGDAEIGRAHV